MATNLAVANCQSIATSLISAIGTSCQILLYTGSAPANADTVASGTLLVTLTGNASQFGTASAGVITLSAVTSGVAGNTGTCGYARILTSGSTKMLDLTSVGTSGSDLNLNSTSITSGASVTITSATITVPYP